jgi:uncharacterized OB-fold protein
MSTMHPPQPLVDADTAPFWAALREHRLEVSHCSACDRFIQPPAERCPRCRGGTAFRTVSGWGTIHTFIVVRHGAVPGFLDSLPYVVALVDIDEQPGVRIPGRLLDVDADHPPAIGSRVAARFVALDGGDFVVPVFVVDES